VTAQGAFRFRDSTWFERVLMPAVEATVAIVGLKEFAYQCDAAPSLVADQLAERNNKGFRVRQLCVLAEIAPRDAQDALSAACVLPGVYEPLRRRQTMTDRERAEALERELLSLGPLGAQIRARALGER